MTHSHAAPAEARPTPTVEDYLAVMYVMERDGEELVPARLAESLEVAPPTVTVTLRRMERDGWIATGGPKGIRPWRSGVAFHAPEDHVTVGGATSRNSRGAPAQFLAVALHDVHHG